MVSVTMPIIDPQDLLRERDELRVWQRTADLVMSDLRAENDLLRAALQGIADNPDPLEGKCYCRWSKGVAQQALGHSKCR